MGRLSTAVNVVQQSKGWVTSSVIGVRDCMEGVDSIVSNAADRFRGDTCLIDTSVGLSLQRLRLSSRWSIRESSIQNLCFMANAIG